jgi:filamentous hemagglutinin
VNPSAHRLVFNGARGCLMAAPETTVVVNSATPANQQPVVTTTASGVTQVNIQTAVGGVSRNSYTQFDD